jgi:hypothetical protein
VLATAAVGAVGKTGACTIGVPVVPNMLVTFGIKALFASLNKSKLFSAMHQNELEKLVLPRKTLLVLYMSTLLLFFLLDKKNFFSFRFFERVF